MTRLPWKGAAIEEGLLQAFDRERWDAFRLSLDLDLRLRGISTGIRYTPAHRRVTVKVTPAPWG